MRTVNSMVLLAFFGASSALAASNATLVTVEGVVMANQGDEYLPAEIGTELSAGDRVMVMEESFGVVQFGEECSVEIKPGDVITIPVQSPCGQESLTAADLSGPLGGLPGEYTAGAAIDTIVGLSVYGVTASALLASCLTDNWPCDGNGRRDDTVSP